MSRIASRFVTVVATLAGACALSLAAPAVSWADDATGTETTVGSDVLGWD